jgi:hypothetical protein
VIGLEDERPIPIDAAHSDICKFSGVADPRFTPVLAQIEKCASLAVFRSKGLVKDHSRGNISWPSSPTTMLTDLLEVSNQSTSTIKRPSQYFIVPFDPNPQFYGRISELEMLDELLTASDTMENPTYPIVAIYGLGGIGYVWTFIRYFGF